MKKHFLCLNVLIIAAVMLMADGQTDAATSQKHRITVWFNAIKNHVIALLLSDEPVSEVCAKLTRLFLTNPVCVRHDRQVARKKTSPRAALHYQKRKRKFCY